MNWYIVKIVFNIDIDNGKHNTQFDEQWRTILAGSTEEALDKAMTLGLEQEESFQNANRRQVHWKFIGISEIHSLEELEDGKEIYSNTHETQESKEYIRAIKNKSSLIQDKSAVFI